MCNASILFSAIPLCGLVAAYSVFCGLILLMALIVPMVPIARNASVTKTKILAGIGEQLEHATARIRGAQGSEQTTEEFETIERLWQLRNMVSTLQVIPFRTKYLRSAFSIVFASAVPVALQLLLPRFLSGAFPR